MSRPPPSSARWCDGGVLRAEKDGVFARSYRITDDGRAVTTFDPSWWHGGGTFTVVGHRYTVGSAAWGRTYTLTDEQDRTVATAQKAGRRDWTVEAGGVVYRFRRVSFWSGDQALLRDDREVGRVTRASVWTGGAVAELPWLSTALRVFVVAVVLTMWQQQTSAAVASGGGG